MIKNVLEHHFLLSWNTLAFLLKESWAPKNWCFWTVVLEKTLESPLDCKEIQPVHPKGNQSGIFTGRIDAEAETLTLWPPDVKNWLTGKDPDAGKDWGQEEKGTTEDEMVGWHHQLNGHEFQQALGVGDGQGSLACCSPWGRKELDMTELNRKGEKCVCMHIQWGDQVMQSNFNSIVRQEACSNVLSYLAKPGTACLPWTSQPTGLLI